MSCPKTFSSCKLIDLNVRSPTWQSNGIAEKVIKKCDYTEKKMKFGRLSIVVSTHAAQFEAVAFKGDFEANVAKIAGWGYEGVELAIRDPDLVDAIQLGKLLTTYRLKVPALGTGQAWGEEKLSFTSADGAVRKAAIGRIKRQI